MPNTHYRGVFDAAGGGVLGSSNDGVFVPRPQNNQTQTIKRRNKKLRAQTNTLIRTAKQLLNRTLCQL